jgi:bacterial/archaeal transporter family-2 protein
VHLSGLILSAVLLYLRRGENIREWQSLPWYMLVAGVFGLILIVTMSITLPRLGAATMIALIIIGQLTIGVLVDHFGLLGVPVQTLNPARLVGVIALLVGGYLIAR